MGIVYHTNYIRWFVIGRNELFRDMCILYTEIEAAGFSFPLTQVQCHYLLSARYDDIVLDEADIEYPKRASMKFICRIWDQNRKNLLAEGYTVHACTDRSGKIIRIPQMVVEKIRQFYPNI